MRSRQVVRTGCLAASIVIATDATAQTIESRESTSPAGVSLSFAPLKEVSGGSGFLTSAQFPLTSNVYVEGEFTHRWDERFGFQRLAISTAGGNLVFRAGSRRWGGFVGAGLGAERSRLDQELVFPFQFSLPPDRFAPSVRYGLAGLILGGAEVSFTRRLTAFGDIRIRSDLREGARVGVGGGLRTFISTGPAPPRQPVEVGTRAARPGTEVRVALSDGDQRSGRLVALTPSEVVIVERGATATLALDRVRRVETISHHARTGTLVGAAWAGFVWITVAATRDSCGDCEDGIYAAALMTPAALGAGAGIGALINAATRGRHILYQSETHKPVMTAIPRLAPDRAALMVNVRW